MYAQISFLKQWEGKLFGGRTSTRKLRAWCVLVWCAKKHAPEPPSQLAPWPYTKIPWDRIHIDHAGPFENHLILLVVDAATKWLEAILVPSTSSTATVTALRSVFARFGLPRTVVSDNGSSFTSQEFTDFMKKSGIIHVRTAPYHPQSNGQAERLVRTMKDSLKKNQSGTFQERLDNFLFHYRKAPNVATGLSPANAMFGRPIRSRLDLLRPEDTGSLAQTTSAPRFQPQESVWCRNHGHGPKWVPGEVACPLGNVMSKVLTPAGVVVRHQDQLRRRESGVLVPGTFDEPDGTSSLPNSCS
ncbi:hypothetical protein JTE90_001901 [Oedothorax gibbosus]|uniref:Integrase catalytic domain-containing protein n=1 Tax=Oedothorax gibbosus TaxID=931172 RepID=A0AAV6VWD9_9ARAC|nr:hypothetical protein JTE90_001901 [Oedothorax gibbosus]